MKRPASEYATLLALLDEALELPEETERAGWIDRLPELHAGLRPTLRRMLLETAALDPASPCVQSQIAALVQIVVAQPETAELAAGEHVGPYKLVREIGRGGMGFVWLANRADGAFKRVVALKLPFATWADRLSERMARERDILAGLEHPNIARFYDAGVDAHGRPFMAMEYVEGQAIDLYCRERKLLLRERLLLVLEVAKAVAYAHSKLVVHRDLKPANLLVTAAGSVRLLDFGIAKLIEGDSVPASNVTQFAARLLTPDYASPEQIRGESIGTATDVYSLAVVTYELLTGARPYRLTSQSAANIEHAITEVDPPLASDAVHDRLLQRQLRGDLDAVLNKAMKKAPAERYGTVDAFAADVQRYLIGETVLARPDGVAYRLRKLAGRHRFGLTAATAVLLALIAATTVSLLQAREARWQAERATATKNFLIDVFRANDPRIASDRPRGEITARELLDLGSARIEREFAAQPELQIELLGLTADMYDYMSDEKHYAAAQKRRIELAQAYYGPAHPIVIQGLLNEADAACLREDYTKATRLLEATDASLRAAHLDKTVMRANWWRTKARASNGLGRRAEFRQALKQALALYAAVAPRSNDYAAALSLASLEQTEQGNNLSAAQLLEQALGVAEAAPGRDDSSIADYLYNLARTRERLGQFAAAVDTYLRAEAQAKKTYGERHAVYWISLAHHAQLLHERGQRDAADKLFTQMLVSIPSQWTTNGLDQWAREIYAECLAAEGRVREAVPLLESAYQTDVARGRADFAVREVRRKLGDAYDRLGRHAEARVHLQAAHDESAAKDDPSSPWSLRMRERWARFLLDHSHPGDADFAAAEQEFNAIIEKVAGKPLLEAALARSGLARIAGARGALSSALDESVHAMTALERVQGLYDIRVQPRLWLVHSALLLENGDAAGARRWADKALIASVRYDDPASSGITAARDALRLAGAAPIH